RPCGHRDRKFRAIRSGQTKQLPPCPPRRLRLARPGARGNDLRMAPSRSCMTPLAFYLDLYRRSLSSLEAGKTASGVLTFLRQVAKKANPCFFAPAKTLRRRGEDEALASAGRRGNILAIGEDSGAPSAKAAEYPLKP